MWSYNFISTVFYFGVYMEQLFSERQGWTHTVIQFHIIGQQHRCAAP